MAVQDLYNSQSATQSIDPATITADTNGTSVDLAGYHGCTIYALIGESGDTLSGSVKIEMEVEESTDNSTFTDVADADLFNSVTGTNTGTFAVVDAAAEDDAVYVTGYRGNSRYIRPVINLTGTHTNGTPIGVVVVRHGGRSKPNS